MQIFYIYSFSHSLACFFFCFFFLRYLVDLRPHISQGSDARSEISHVYAFKLVFVLFTRFFFFCHCVYSIISFLFGDASSFYFPSSADGFDAVSRIEVCASRSVLIISSFLISSFYKKINMFLKNFL